MAVYRCKEAFCIDACDGDGFTVGEMIIDAGTIWELDDSPSRIVGGEIRLENGDCQWLEIPKEHLAAYFEGVE